MELFNTTSQSGANHPLISSKVSGISLLLKQNTGLGVEFEALNSDVAYSNSLITDCYGDSTISRAEILMSTSNSFPQQDIMFLVNNGDDACTKAICEWPVPTSQFSSI